MLPVDRMVCGPPDGHPLARQPAVRLEDLGGAPLVHLAPDNGLSATAWVCRAVCGLS
ncbi:hypothetical protein [Streptomyces sp. DASNCL29]|uniref:hypothetical protein n=1 Tax=Streptomyces sp. DASNCL29 TaxID=2583819 RepID=UPI0019CF4E28|nr:hypothetical protein [Streptomyces sp. DASNCL29]